jgi:DNA-binding MarR family transcriptional regulator
MNDEVPKGEKTVSEGMETKLGESATESMLARQRVARANIRFERIEAMVLVEYGLTPVQYYVLTHLIDKPGQNQQELAGRLLVTKGNICGLINRMEKAGLVERRPNPDDRRSYQLHITESGWAAYNVATPVIAAAVEQKLACLDANERELVSSLLDRIDRMC